MISSCEGRNESKPKNCLRMGSRDVGSEFIKQRQGFHSDAAAFARLSRRVRISAFSGVTRAMRTQQPRARGFPEGLLDQPFTAGCKGRQKPIRALQRAYQRALAFAIVIVSNLLKTLNSGSLLMMFLLITDVVYHPFQILRAETHNAVARLPVQ